MSHLYPDDSGYGWMSPEDQDRLAEKMWNEGARYMRERAAAIFDLPQNQHALGKQTAQDLADYIRALPIDGEDSERKSE